MRKPRKERPLGPLGERILAYWQEHRPKDTEQLRQAGKLHQHCLDLQDRGRDLLLRSQIAGLNEFEARELLAELVFPPSEQEQPNLGESPEHSLPMPSPEETTSRRRRAPSR